MAPAIPQELADLLQQVLGRFKGRHAALAADIWAVALGLRTGLLIDTLLVEEEQAKHLGLELRKLGILYKNLVVVHEPQSSQTFVLTRPLLLFRMCGPPPLLLDVGGSSPLLLTEVPPSLLLLLDTIAELSTSASFVNLVLPALQPTSLLVALAGFLLEYPVVYWLGDSIENCLGGRDDLMLVRAVLSRDQLQSHTLLAFSFPSSVAGLPPAEQVRQELETTLRGRLEIVAGAQGGGWTSSEVALVGPVSVERFAL